MKKTMFRFTGKRKNPTTPVDVQIQSDRFDGLLDRSIVTVWAGDLFKVFVFGLDFSIVVKSKENKE